MRFVLALMVAVAPVAAIALGLMVPTPATAESDGTFAGDWTTPSRERHESRRGYDGDDDDDDDDDFARYFVSDPLTDPDAVIVGEALERLTWNAYDQPAFEGDLPGSLSAIYDSSLPAGLFGYRLPRTYSADEAFTAAAVFVIDPETFDADPNGFFQISWGLWNTTTTGLNRSGNFDDFTADTFDLIEFNWFPNVSDFFGGPFLGPTVLGAAVGDPPDAFSNGAFLFDLEVDLPLGVPLLAVLEHRPADDALVTQIYEVLARDRVVPINSAVGVTPLNGMTLREYTVDAVGLTLWQDGFGGPDPAVFADLEFHAIVVRSGVSSGAGF